MASLFSVILVVCVKVVSMSAYVFVLDELNQTIVKFNSESAQFGPRLPSDGTTGHFQISYPVDACSDVNKVPDNRTLWVALVKRQTCSFAKKVFNVQKAGYEAAIVYNVGSDAIFPMKGDGESGPIKIPSLFVGETSGKALMMQYLSHSILLTDERSDSDNSMFFLPFVVVLPLCTIIMCFFLCVRCLMDQVKKRKMRLSRSNLNKLPIKKFKKGSECDTCAICLEEFEDGDKLRQLPCGHAYHQKCIDPWLTKSKQTCPLCNKKIFPQDDDSDVENGNAENHSESTPLLAPRRGTTNSYGISTASARNAERAESDSDGSIDSHSELLPSHVESRVEVHAKPIRNRDTTLADVNQQASGSTIDGIQRPDVLPSITGAMAVGAKGIQHDNEGLGFEEEHFGCETEERTDGRQSSCGGASDPLLVEVRKDNKPSQSTGHANNV